MGFYVRLRVPDSMSQEQAKAELGACISFGSPEITGQYVLPDPWRED